MANGISKRSSKVKRKRHLCKKIAKIFVLFGCLSGFLFQTTEFMLLYWTYPTVVDIQKSSPSYLDIPAITVCNPIGYNYTALCTESGVSAGLCSRRLKNAEVCQQHPYTCVNGQLPKDFTEETHLLPSPYQTNCTDYFKSWRENGGKGPVAQTGVVQECLARRYNEKLDCVPIKVDYPHTNSICGTSVETNVANPTLECINLVDSYNQPCDSISYTAEREEVEITVVKQLVNHYLRTTQDYRYKIKEHDCSGIKVWNPECSRITIDILFDRFEITNLTYHPKFETLELFSAVGGYMGMWLGISLVAVYDFVFTVLEFVNLWMVRRRHKKILPGKNGNSFYGAGRNNKQHW